MVARSRGRGCLHLRLPALSRRHVSLPRRQPLPGASPPLPYRLLSVARLSLKPPRAPARLGRANSRGPTAMVARMRAVSRPPPPVQASHRDRPAPQTMTVRACSPESPPSTLVQRYSRVPIPATAPSFCTRRSVRARVRPARGPHAAPDPPRRSPRSPSSFSSSPLPPSSPSRNPFQSSATIRDAVAGGGTSQSVTLYQPSRLEVAAADPAQRLALWWR